MPPKKVLKLAKHDVSQRKLTSLFKPKEIVSDDEVDLDRPIQIETDSSTPGTSGDADVRPNTASDDSEKGCVKPERNFKNKWLKIWPWLYLDDGKMYCRLCVNHKKINTFTKGCQTFRTSSMERHEVTDDHVWSLKAPAMQSQMETAKKKANSERDEAIIKLHKVVFWLASENLPLTKFDSLVKLLEDLGVKGFGTLKINERVNYQTYYSANEFLEAVSSVLDNEVNKSLQESPFVTVYADESTDITNTKRMTITAKTIDPQTSIPSSIYLKDLEYEDGTGMGLAAEIIKEVEGRGVPFNKIIGFGSDGAKVMTGTGKGVTGCLKKLNPHLVNVHCIAHRLALCTSQAAEGIPCLKKFQEWMTCLFYYFKASAAREQELHKIQALLDNPQLKYKEIHAVRWMSFYEALEAIYRTIDPLITYLNNRDAAKDSKAKGLLKKLATKEFLYIIHLMMDVMPIVSKLCLTFQKDNLDVAMAKISLDLCLGDLQAYCNGTLGNKTYIDILEENLQGNEYMGHRINTNFHSVSLKSKFVNKLIDNIKSRFPQKSLLDSFSVLAMRTINHVADPESYGNDEVQSLMEFYGQQQVHNDSTSEAVLDSGKVIRQWQVAKQIVKAARYPVDSMKSLWELLTTHHKDEIPEIIKLAQIALILPLHTASCERVFSQQNIIVTKQRNRLCPMLCDKLLRVRLVAGRDFSKWQECLDMFYQKKKRLCRAK